jgi:hypothetical protein
MKPKPLPSVEALRALFRYDPNSGKLYWRLRPQGPVHWNTQHAGRQAGSIRQGRRYVQLAGYGLLLGYRIIWKMVYGFEPYMLDHIDGNPRNDRIANLRVATPAQNARNTRPYGKSGFKGVSYSRRRGRWNAQIFLNGRPVNLGAFHCPADAHAAYVRAAKKHFGAFARVK